MIAALVLDFDGTILDTERVVYEAIRAVWRAHDLDLDPVAWAGVVGTSGYQWLDHLALHAGGGFDAVTAERHYGRARDELIEREQPRPGIVALLSEAAAAGVGVAVASNSPDRWCEDHLERLGLRHLVGPVVTVGDVVHPKPHPEPYLRACELLAADPGASVAIEDSSVGVASAVGAGLFTVAVPHPLTASHDLSAAHLVLTTLAGVTLSDLAVHAAARPRVRSVGRGGPGFAP
jgi:putative hydrolase of the HAD superfamily